MLNKSNFEKLIITQQNFKPDACIAVKDACIAVKDACIAVKQKIVY